MFTAEVVKNTDKEVREHFSFSAAEKQERTTAQMAIQLRLCTFCTTSLVKIVKKMITTTSLGGVLFSKVCHLKKTQLSTQHALSALFFTSQIKTVGMECDVKGPSGMNELSVRRSYR